MSTLSKKRKRDLDNAESGGSLLSSAQPATQLGPVLVSFPAVEPPKATPFKCYLRKNPEAGEEDEEKQEFVRQDTLVAGEADSVEYFTSEETKGAAAGCKYFIAVHDRRTQKTIFRPSPLHILVREVKAFKGADPSPVTLKERVTARAALGESFGTKKAQAALKAAERNKVDVSAMDGVMEHLVNRIESNTKTLPTEEQMASDAVTNRLIPAFNPDAADPSDVYSLHDIIPELEWKAMSTSPFTTATSDQDRVGLLPYKRSPWIRQHLRLIFKQEPPSKRQIKLLYYISVMLAFRQAARTINEHGNVGERLSGVSSVIVDGLMNRFTEVPRGSSQPCTTTETETNLLNHMLALCLRVDNYATDTSLIAADLMMPVVTVNRHFRSLGCKIEKLKDRDLQRLGLPDSASETKRAVLKVPLQFPKIRNRRK